MSKRKTVEEKLQDMEYCLGKGSYELALGHASDLFLYCFDRINLSGVGS